MAAPWTTPAVVRESAGKKVAGWLSGYVAGAEFDPVRFPIRGPAAAELGDRYDEARRWAVEWDRAARGPVRVEYKTVGGRSFGANDIPAAAWLDSYDHAWGASRASQGARSLSVPAGEAAVARIAADRHALSRLAAYVAYVIPHDHGDFVFSGDFVHLSDANPSPGKKSSRS